VAASQKPSLSSCRQMQETKNVQFGFAELLDAPNGQSTV
jgi:hypothetical protein